MVLSCCLLRLYFACFAFIPKKSEAWEFSRSRGYYDYPARIFGGVNVTVLVHPSETSDTAYVNLESFLNSGGAIVQRSNGCEGQVAAAILDSVDLIVHYRQRLPDWATGEEKRTLSQIQSLQNAVLKCVNPKHYWKTAILSAKEIVSISNGVPFVAANSQQGLESVYERVMNEANSLIFEPVPPSTRWLFPPPPIIEKAEGIVKDKLYTFGGFLSNWTTFYDKGVVYDLGRSSVEAVKTFPLPKDFSMATQASATDRERYIYIAGGQRVTGCSHGSRTVYRFDAEREEFLRLPDLPHEVQSGMLTYVPHSNTLHYTGGSFNRSVKLFPHAPHYILHLPKEGPSVDKWQTTQKDWKWLEGHPFKDSTLLHHIAVTLKDKKGEEHLYILAGVSRDAGIIQSKRLGETVYECDTARGEPDRRKVFKYSPSGKVPWVRCKDLPIAFSHANPSHVRVAGGKGLLIFGGQTSLLKPTRRYRYSMAVMRHIILYVPSLGISRTVGYLPQWFRGEGAKALMAVRERVPLDGGGYTLGGILLFGGEQADPVNPPAPGVPFAESMIRVSAELWNGDQKIDSIVGGVSYGK